MRVLGLDVGTSSVKAALLDVETARPLTQVVRVPYALEHPTPEAAEINARDLWDAVIRAARQAADGASGIEAVGLSCFTPGLALLDRSDQPIGSIWTHL